MSDDIVDGVADVSLRERRRTQTRDLIAQVALDRFERQGFKATTVEGMGAIGRREGISVMAVETVAR